jgi:hypothetical protein
MRRRAAKGAALVAGVALGSAAIPITQSAADNVNMSWTPLWHGSGKCIHARAEIDHDVDQHHRYYWAARNTYDDPTYGTQCLWTETAYSRIKGESYRADLGAGIFSLCLGTVGDGLGDGGYVHRSASTWGINSQWFDNGECGTGDYKAKTYAHRQNGGWQGGEITSGTHAFK